MIPGMNPKDVAKAMKRLGIQQQEIEAEEVIIRTAEKDLVIRNPSVSKVNMMGQETFQISGVIEEMPREITISEEDLKTVIEQTHATREKALAVIKKNKGDLAAAIMELHE